MSIFQTNLNANYDKLAYDFNFKDLDGFKKSCLLVKDLGYAGKACIHPNQIEIANNIFNEK